MQNDPDSFSDFSIDLLSKEGFLPNHLTEYTVLSYSSKKDEPHYDFFLKICPNISAYTLFIL